MYWKRLPQLSKNPHNAQTLVQRFLMGDIHSPRGNYTQWSIHTTGVSIPYGYGDQNLNKQNEALQSDCIVQSREEIWGHYGQCVRYRGTEIFNSHQWSSEHTLHTSLHHSAKRLASSSLTADRVLPPCTANDYNSITALKQVKTEPSNWSSSFVVETLSTT